MVDCRTCGDLLEPSLSQIRFEDYRCRACKAVQNRVYRARREANMTPEQLRSSRAHYIIKKGKERHVRV